MKREITPKQLAALKTEAQRLMTRFPAEVARIKSDMLNFDIPAQRAINAGFARMGADRFTRSGDDVWEMITAIEGAADGWEYRRPPAHLIARWAGY